MDIRKYEKWGVLVALGLISAKCQWAPDTESKAAQTRLTGSVLIMRQLIDEVGPHLSP